MTRYNFRNFRQAINNPRLFLGLLNEWGETVNQWYHKHFTPNDGIYVMDQDWDFLIILDACRFDLFKSQDRLEGDLSRVKSRGGTSEEFFAENFAEHEYGDTVYVGANPYVSDYVESFHDSKLLFADEYWDESVDAVPPEVVASGARKAANEYRDKRLIIHFMQPHLPAIGSVREEIPIHHNPVDSSNSDSDHNTGDVLNLGYKGNLRHQQNGVTPRLVRRAHEENLDIVLDVVERLLVNLNGKVVVTADHGDLFGERLRPIPTRGYLHEWHLRHESLVTVPWLEIKSDTRPEISDDGVRSMDVDQQQVQDRLKSLGYI